MSPRKTVRIPRFEFVGSAHVRFYIRGISHIRTPNRSIERPTCFSAIITSEFPCQANPTKSRWSVLKASLDWKQQGSIMTVVKSFITYECIGVLMHICFMTLALGQFWKVGI